MLATVTRHAQRLLVPASVDRIRLLSAIAMAESTGGRNLQPNFEPAFYEGGKYWNAHLVELRAQWQEHADPEMKEFAGKAVACSWGPWQVLYVTAEEMGYWGPPWALTSPDVCLAWAITLINKRIVPKLPSPNGPALDVVGDIADGYNSGNPRDANRPHGYVDKIRKLYQTNDLTDKLASFGNFGNFG